MDRLYVLAAALILAGFLSGGLYTTSGSSGLYVVNRFTGTVWFCGLGSCLQYKNSN